MASSGWPSSGQSVSFPRKWSPWSLVHPSFFRTHTQSQDVSVRQNKYTFPLEGKSACTLEERRWEGREAISLLEARDASLSISLLHTLLQSAFQADADPGEEEDAEEAGKAEKKIDEMTV